MFTYVLLGLVAYYIYTNVMALVNHQGPWELVQWVMLLMTVAFVVVFIILSRRAIAQNKKQKQEKIDAEKRASQSLEESDSSDSIEAEVVGEQDTEQTDDEQQVEKKLSKYDE